MTNTEGNGDLADTPVPFFTATRPARPVDVERSLRLWWYAIGGAAVSDILGLVLPQHTALLNLLNLPSSSSVAIPKIFPLVARLVALAIWIMLVRLVGQGSNSARWWLTVLAAIEELAGIAGVVSAFYQPTVSSVVLGVLGIGIFVVVLLAIVAMHKPAARIHFERLA